MMGGSANPDPTTRARCRHPLLRILAPQPLVDWTLQDIPGQVFLNIFFKKAGACLRTLARGLFWRHRRLVKTFKSRSRRRTVTFTKLSLKIGAAHPMQNLSRR